MDKIIIRQNDSGVWERFHGEPRQITYMAKTVKVLKYDGSDPIEDHPWDPYPVTVNVDPMKIAGFYNDGTWDDANLAKYGLVACVPFEEKDGYEIVSGPEYKKVGDRFMETYKTKKMPAQEPRAEPETAALSPKEKLALIGLTREELRTLLADV